MTLRRIVENRRAAGIAPRPLIVITDVAKDYDDLAALVVLKELHRLGLIDLRAVITNLLPADKRMGFAVGALQVLGLPHVPVACGTRGTDVNHAELSYEFDCPFMEAPSYPQMRGQDLLKSAYEDAKLRQESAQLLCLSSLQDIHEFAEAWPQLVAECTAEVHMQGGNYLSPEGDLIADAKAANNSFNFAAASKWHKFMQAHGLTSYTYTKAAAFATKINSDPLFVQLKDTGNPIGVHLRHVQVMQDLAFYTQACEVDPEKRFRPSMDQQWFLENKTDYYDHPHPEHEPLPVGDEVIPYLRKVVVYDALAALGSAGQDAMEALQVFQPQQRCTLSTTRPTSHWIVGGDGSSGILAENLSVALSALLKGSLLAVEQMLSSHPHPWATSP